MSKPVICMPTRDQLRRIAEASEELVVALEVAHDVTVPRGVWHKVSFLYYRPENKRNNSSFQGMHIVEVEKS